MNNPLLYNTEPLFAGTFLAYSLNLEQRQVNDLPGNFRRKCSRLDSMIAMGFSMQFLVNFLLGLLVTLF